MTFCYNCSIVYSLLTRNRQMTELRNCTFYLSSAASFCGIFQGRFFMPSLRHMDLIRLHVSTILTHFFPSFICFCSFRSFKQPFVPFHCVQFRPISPFAATDIKMVAQYTVMCIVLSDIFRSWGPRILNPCKLETLRPINTLQSVEILIIRSPRVLRVRR